MPRTGALNMAIDELLLQTAQVPILRFYRWTEPSISFGYFGRFEEAEAFANKKGLDYTIIELHERSLKPKSYADNFRYDRVR